MQQLLFVCNHISHSPRDERAEDYAGHRAYSLARSTAKEQSSRNAKRESRGMTPSCEDP